MKLGEVLIRLRHRLDLSQRKVADYVGVKQNTYQSWECDKTSVKDRFLPKLAEVLRVPVTNLLPPTSQLISTKLVQTSRSIHS